jgi:hypothetical protein
MDRLAEIKLNHDLVAGVSKKMMTEPMKRAHADRGWLLEENAQLQAKQSVIRFPTTISAGDQVSINGEQWKVSCMSVSDGDEDLPDRMMIELVRLYRHKVETSQCKEESNVPETPTDKSHP